MPNESSLLKKPLASLNVEPWIKIRLTARILHQRRNTTTRYFRVFDRDVTPEHVAEITLDECLVLVTIWKSTHNGIGHMPLSMRALLERFESMGIRVP